MKKPILRMMMGLPASGKSTAAEDLVEFDGWVQVEKDIIRKDDSLFGEGGYNYKRGDEAIVIRERNKQIRNALDANKNVVSSDTNLSPKHRGQLRLLATECKAEFEIDNSFLDVPVATCIERDKDRDDSVGQQVILEMYYRYVHPGFHNKNPGWRERLPRAFIIDLDGTLAMMGDRSPYDTSRVFEDTPNYALTHILDAIDIYREPATRERTKYTHIVLMSGRKEAAREATERWLKHWAIPYDALFMRSDGDNRKDSIVKKELYEDNLKGQYNILAVFDDRPQVVDMWRRELGLMVFQAADHDLKF